jgi:dipeptide/tripeptide permease
MFSRLMRRMGIYVCCVIGSIASAAMFGFFYEATHWNHRGFKVFVAYAVFMIIGSFVLTAYTRFQDGKKERQEQELQKRRNERREMRHLSVL